MRKFATAIMAGVAMSFALTAVAVAKDKTIAVSWKTFQEERWKTDEAAIKAVVEAAGDKYISTDAQGSAQKQAADIEGLIAQNVDVILIVAFDSDAILPSIQKISDAGIGLTWCARFTASLSRFPATVRRLATSWRRAATSTATAAPPE